MFPLPLLTREMIHPDSLKYIKSTHYIPIRRQMIPLNEWVRTNMKYEMNDHGY